MRNIFFILLLSTLFYSVSSDTSIISYPSISFFTFLVIFLTLCGSISGLIYCLCKKNDCFDNMKKIKTI